MTTKTSSNETSCNPAETANPDEDGCQGRDTAESSTGQRTNFHRDSECDIPQQVESRAAGQQQRVGHVEPLAEMLRA